MFKVRILVSQFYWFLSLNVCIPAIELKGGLLLQLFPMNMISQIVLKIHSC